MADIEITQEQIDAVYPAVADIVADTLGVDEDEVQPKLSLIEDLDAESIDFLDLVFRLEREFKIKIPRGKIVEDSRGELSEEEFDNDGEVSEAGYARIKTFLSEVPEERFPSPLMVDDIPKLFTVETFCKLVVRAQHDSEAAG